MTAPMKPEPSEPDRMVTKIAIGFCLGLLVGAMFQSQALVTLAYDLEPGPVADQITTFAEQWHGLMQTLGTADWVQTLSDTLEAWRPTPFSFED